MANEIEMAYSTGAAVYAIVTNGGGQVWNGTGFEAPSSSDWASYAVALSEASGTGVYFGSFPGGIATAGLYRVIVYARSGSTPTPTDTAIGGGQISWTGTFEGVIVAGYASGQDPAALLLANARFKNLCSYVDGKYSYNPSSGTITFYDQDGATVLFDAVLTFDESGNITSRVIG
ncbi:MAG: hypothetical protein P4L33_03315 [Capsulimonadaceae bacterium]|nr:hypothetical protein [Capsulimonadaceae bacterium]